MQLGEWTPLRVAGAGRTPGGDENADCKRSMITLRAIAVGELIRRYPNTNQHVVGRDRQLGDVEKVGQLLRPRYTCTGIL